MSLAFTIFASFIENGEGVEGGIVKLRDTQDAVCIAGVSNCFMKMKQLELVAI